MFSKGSMKMSALPYTHNILTNNESILSDIVRIILILEKAILKREHIYKLQY